MTHTEALKMARGALKIGRDCAAEVAQRLHTELAGYRQHKHDAADADVAKIDAAIAALDALQSAQPSAPGAEPAERTLLEQYDREQLPGYREGYEDGRQRGYTVGHRHGLEQTAAYATAPAAPAPAQAEPVAAQTEWRKLALQFDAQRMSALWHLRALLQDPAGHADAAREFLAAPPAAAAPLRPLTEAAILRIVQRTIHGRTLRLTRDVGPYEVTEPTHDLCMLVGAIERAHGINPAKEQP